MVHEPGSQSGRLIAKTNVCRRKLTFNQKPTNWSNQVAGDYTPDRLPFSSKSQKSSGFLFSPVHCKGTSKTALLHPLILLQTALQLLSKLYLPHALRQTNCFGDSLAGHFPLATERIGVGQGC